MELAVGIWLLMGLASAMIASSKRLGVGTYFVVGAFLGPLGVLLALLSKPAEPEVPARWAPDPFGRHQHRYWDGTRWTDKVADAGAEAVDPAA